MPPRRVALLLLGLSSSSSAILVTSGHVEHHRSQGLRRAEALRERVLLRFAQVDANGDGVVHMAEMREGFGHAPAHVGEALLREMLAACAGGDARADACTQRQMESSLDALADQREADLSESFAGLALERVVANASDEFSDGEPCGPWADFLLGEPVPGMEGVVCTEEGARCVRNVNLLSWHLSSLCADRACICFPTPATKRLAKVGVMGTGAATAMGNGTGGEVHAPQCGGGWTATLVVDRMEGVNGLFNEMEQLVAETFLQRMVPGVLDRWWDSDHADTEVGFFKSSQHELVEGKPDGRVCMFSWQPSRNDGDWKLSTLMTHVPLDYWPPGVSATTQRGFALSYGRLRERLKRLFEEECCSPGFEAEKLIISGHSRGAGLAELQAIDAVANWQCNGRDLGAKDIALVLGAPPQALPTSAVIDEVFSCSDPANCLSGSVVTLTLAADIIGDPLVRAASCRHVSEVYRLPCPAPQLYDLPVSKFWCHTFPHYVQALEEHLVGRARWGSSCGGTCGNPNRMLQCHQVVMATGIGCGAAPSRWLTSEKVATGCDANWLPSEERCACDFERCDALTTLGCVGLEAAVFS